MGPPRALFIQDPQDLRSYMRIRIFTVLTAAGLISFMPFPSALAQSGDDKMTPSEAASGNSGKKMSRQEATDKMSAMSTDDKAAMYDKMTQKQKMMAMKKSGQKMGHDGMMGGGMGKKSGEKMGHDGMMGGMGEMSGMSNQEKADMFDKMPMSTKMDAMNGGSGMHHHNTKNTEK
jgi:hypothetical protein